MIFLLTLSTFLFYSICMYVCIPYVYHHISVYPLVCVSLITVAVAVVVTSNTTLYTKSIKTFHLIIIILASHAAEKTASSSEKRFRKEASPASYLFIYTWD